MSNPSRSTYGRDGPPVPAGRSPDALFDALANRRRREILSALADRRGPVAEADLVSRVVACEEGKPLREVRDEEHRRVRASVHHAHLPKLADAGLVTRHDDETVTATDHPLFRASEFDAVLRRAETDAAATDAALAALADERRRTMLAVLSEAGSLTETELAESVAAAGDALGGSGRADSAESVDDDDSTGDSDDGVARVLTGLRHVHLPVLARAALVTRDADAGTVAYEGHPAIEDRWFDRPFGSSPSATVGRDGDVWTLDGRAAVLDRSREVCESADRELVVVLPADDRLDEAQLSSFRGAVERGVDVSVGVHSPAIRSLVRDRVPGATVWEPRLDPVSGDDALGLLVLADGESVVLGSLVAGDAGTETGVAGEGEHNPLVGLLDGLLGARRDGPTETAFDEVVR